MGIIPYYDKVITCINCQKSFKTTKIRQSTTKLTTTDSDFKPSYSGINLLYYHVFVCEFCGISFTKDFSTYFPPGTQETIKERICAHWTPHSFNGERNLDQAIQSYQLAIICGEIKKEKHVVLAGLALKTAWLYRDQGKKEWELRFLESARNKYVECYLIGDYQGTSMTEFKVLYLIGELSRRIGDFSTATKYFSRIIEQQRTSTERRIIQLTKDIWQDMRIEQGIQ